jgi:RNA polymerase sigma factor (sigma-70 family)
MPSIDELEEIMELAHIQFEDFQGQLYWSCQPAYKKHDLSINYLQQYSRYDSYKSQGFITGTYYTDNVNRARATRVKRENGQFKEVLSSSSDTYGKQNGNLYITVLSSDRNDFENWLDEIELREAIKTLQPREKKILYLRFFKGRTQVEVADEIGISQAQVSRLEKGAIDFIKGT